MKERQDYIQDIAEIRSMMERSSKFLSLAGWAGIMAGVYALLGALVAYKLFAFNPTEIFIDAGSNTAFLKIFLLAVLILVLAIGTAVFLSKQKANRQGEKLWNATARRLMVSMAVPLVAGGLLMLIFISKSLIGLVIPASLIFYGIALYNAGKFTYEEVKMLGLIEISLGLVSAYFVHYGLVCWALGFGAVHIIYGIYIHNRYER